MAESYNWGNAEDRDRFAFHLNSRIVNESVTEIRVDGNSFELHFENGAVVRIESKQFDVILNFPEQSKIVQSQVVQ